MNTTLVQTVDGQKELFTRRAVRDASSARKLQKALFSPSDRDMLRIVDNNLLPNSPITRDALIAANRIYGPDINALKGKTVSRKTA